MFRFREIRETPDEIKQREEQERQIALNGYLQIKPETSVTVEECNNFWNDIFGED